MQSENTRVFIGNIYYSITESDLKLLFSKAGCITKLDLFTDESGKSRGCGIITYTTRVEALQAITLFNNTELHTRLITVKEDETFYLQQKPAQITITGMPPTVTWQQLKDVCREMGEVLRADIKLQSNRTASGTVLFDNNSQAAKAVELLNGATFNGMKVSAFCEFDN
jgi:RNA recognition motif-containing protein